MARAMVTQIMVAHGPSTTASSPPPTAWAEVPPGMGTLYIIMVKEKAAPMAIKGTYLDLSQFLTFRAAATQAGIMTRPKLTQVEGLKYPSGMCKINPPYRSGASRPRVSPKYPQK